MAESGGGPYLVKRNDTSKPITGRLYDADGALFPLPVGTAVWFAMRPAVDGVPGPTFKKLARIVQTPGRVAYDWVAADVAFAGPFKGEWEVTTPTGPQTFPSDGYLNIVILPDVG